MSKKVHMNLIQINVDKGTSKIVVSARQTDERIIDRITVLKMDDRLYEPDATIDTNAPLAIIQIVLKTELNTLERVMGLTPCRRHWLQFYWKACQSLHMSMETREELYKRLPS